MSLRAARRGEVGFDSQRRKLLEASLTIIGIFFSIFQIKKLNRTKQFFGYFLFFLVIFVFFDWGVWIGLGVGLGETNTGSGS
jgi:hypothetical protein